MQQAGLGAALGAPQKQGQDLSGMMSMMHMLKDVPDQTLADVLAGKPVHLDIDGMPTQVPQFAAMLAAQGRQQLRTAMAGQQAPQQSIKDQLLAAEQQAANPQSMIVPPQQGMAPPQQMGQGAPETQAGLDQIPAPNMQHMRAGGITGEEVPRFNGEKDSVVKYPNQAIADDAAMYENIGNFFAPHGPVLDAPTQSFKYVRDKVVQPFLDWTQESPEEQAKKFRAASARKEQAANPDKFVPVPVAPLKPRVSDTTGSWGDPVVDSKKETKKETKETPTEGGLPEVLKAKQAAGPSAPKTDAGPKIMTLEDTQKMIQADPMYQSINNTIEGLKDKHSRFQSMLDEYAKAEPERKKEIEDRKSQGIGEYMMNMGAALVSNPQFGKAIQEGNTAGLAALNLSRKEAKEMQKDYRDYGFNMQKAAEAAEQGNQELAQRYQANGIQLQNAIGESVYKANQSSIAAYEAPFTNRLKQSQAKYYDAMPGIMANRYADPNLKYEKITPPQAETAWAKMTRGEKEKLAVYGVRNAIQYQQYWNNGQQPMFNVVQEPKSGRIVE